MNPARGEPPLLLPQPKYFSVRVPFTPADLEAGRRSMSCHRTQYSDDVVQRITELSRQVWSGALLLMPFFATDTGNDLFQSPMKSVP